MTFISIDPQPNTDCSSEKKKATAAWFDRFRKVGRAFWAYTEETGEASTKSYEGLL